MNDLENLQAPHNFGVCASACCTKRFTCLRYIALQNASLQYPFLPTLTPRKLESMKGKCEYYRPNTPVRYARGFTRVAELLTVRWRAHSACGLFPTSGVRTITLPVKESTLSILLPSNTLSARQKLSVCGLMTTLTSM